MKVHMNSIKTVYDEIVKEVAKIPQVDLEAEEFKSEDVHKHYFMNIKQAGTRKLYFTLTEDTNYEDPITRLFFVIAIQEPPAWNIESHHFIEMRYVEDMIELTKYQLGLNGRI